MNPIPEYLPVKEQNAVMNRTKVVETAAFEHIFIRPSNYVRLQNKSLKRETSKIPIPTTGGIKKKLVIEVLRLILLLHTDLSSITIIYSNIQ